MTTHPYPDVTVAQVGNFEPPHSTENELRRALAMLGVTVRTYQEGDPTAWDALASDPAPDLVLWTRTRGLLDRIPNDTRRAALAALSQSGTPVVGYHLDIWHGLARADEVHPSAAYFGEVDVLATADGGHDDAWAALGIDHWWFPPAVSVLEAQPGTPRPDLYGDADVCFVGSWQGGYHPEAAHRHDLIRFLRDAHTAGRWRVAFYPHQGQPAIRGSALADLYATHTIAVGDSALLGPRYYSDRIPETLGRAGCLAHPHVPDVIPADAYDPGLFRPGHDLLTWEPGDWTMLGDIIDGWLAYPDQVRQIGLQGRQTVLAAHTYTHRMTALLAAVGRLGSGTPYPDVVWADA